MNPKPNYAIVSIFILGSVAVGGRAEDTELKATVERAWRGGGAEKLKAVKAWSMTEKNKSLESVEHNYTRTAHVQLPDRLWSEVVSAGKDGNKTNDLTVVNGSKGWKKVDGIVTEMTEQQVADMITDMRYGGFQRVLSLDAPNFSLELMPEGTVADKTTSAVRIKQKNNLTEVLHIDKEAGMIVMQDMSNRFARVEIFFTDFKKVDDIPIAHTRTIVQNGKLIYERKLLVKFVEEQNDKLFEKP